MQAPTARANSIALDLYSHQRAREQGDPAACLRMANAVTLVLDTGRDLRALEAVQSCNHH